MTDGIATGFVSVLQRTSAVFDETHILDEGSFAAEYRWLREINQIRTCYTIGGKLAAFDFIRPDSAPYGAGNLVRITLQD